MGDQVLGGGLPGAAGDGHDRRRLAGEPVGGDVEERLTGVIDLDDGGPFDSLRWALAEDAGSPTLDRLGNEDVPVVLLASERDEQAARLDFPGIDEELAEAGVMWPAE